MQAETEINQDRGEIVVGSFVEVTFLVRDGVNVAMKIVSLVPPGAGDDNARGMLRLRAEGTATASAQTWYIGGQPYQISAATFLDDSRAAFADGQAVSVNAYTDPATGQRVATQITALTALYQTYIPTLAR